MSSRGSASGSWTPAHPSRPPRLGDRVRKTEYQDIAPFATASINDDRVQTWTSSSAGKNPQRTFRLVVCGKHGGVIIRAPFEIALPADTHVFLLLPAREVKPVLWVVGGIGAESFLARRDVEGTRGRRLYSHCRRGSLPSCCGC